MSGMRNGTTGDAVLSQCPGAKAWSDFFALLHSIDVPADFMADRPLNVAPKARGVFDDGVSAGGDGDR